VERACRGQYPLADAEDIPRHYLTKYCLKGIGSQDGTFIVGRELRARIKFLHANLKADLSKLGNFDVIFLRNVLIYFDMETKQQVVANLLRHLKRGGYLIVGHSESLNGVSQDINAVMPSVYRRP
jgi:chemotaxis protein methyltransferase CheR